MEMMMLGIGIQTHSFIDDAWNTQSYTAIG